MTTKDVAIIFDDITEFNTIKPGIEELKSNNISFDIIVPFDSGYADLPTKTTEAIKHEGFKVKTDAPKNVHYKVLLTPYPGLEVVNRMDFDYHIKYCYGVLSAKPNPVYLPYQKIQYHAIMLFNNYEMDLYRAYGAETYFLPFWRYKNFKKRKHAGKPTLLLLPTFGDVSCIDLISDESVKILKQKYRVITKSHHALDSNPAEKQRLGRLKEVVDEFYDSNAKIEELLAISDVVLSDNSGAIFEALYARVPVAILSENPNARALDELNTCHYRLIKKGVLPYTNNPKGLPRVVDEAIAKQDAQALESKRLFSPPKDGSKKGDFAEIIKEYLDRDPKNDYRKILHDMMVSEYTENAKKSSDYEAQIRSIYDSRSWKITRPLRRMTKKIKRKE